MKFLFTPLLSSCHHLRWLQKSVTFYYNCSKCKMMCFPSDHDTPEGRRGQIPPNNLKKYHRKAAFPWYKATQKWNHSIIWHKKLLLLQLILSVRLKPFHEGKSKIQKTQCFITWFPVASISQYAHELFIEPNTGSHLHPLYSLFCSVYLLTEVPLIRCFTWCSFIYSTYFSYLFIVNHNKLVEKCVGGKMKREECSFKFWSKEFFNSEIKSIKKSILV